MYYTAVKQGERGAGTLKYRYKGLLMEQGNVKRGAFVLLLFFLIESNSFCNAQTKKEQTYDNCKGAIYGQ